jgi:hypothetical protein
VGKRWVLAGVLSFSVRTPPSPSFCESPTCLTTVDNDTTMLCTHFASASRFFIHSFNQLLFSLLYDSFLSLASLFFLARLCQKFAMIIHNPNPAIPLPFPTVRGEQRRPPPSHQNARLLSLVCLLSPTYFSILLLFFALVEFVIATAVVFFLKKIVFELVVGLGTLNANRVIVWIFQHSPWVLRELKVQVGVGMIFPFSILGHLFLLLSTNV